VLCHINSRRTSRPWFFRSEKALSAQYDPPIDGGAYCPDALYVIDDLVGNPKKACNGLLFVVMHTARDLLKGHIGSALGLGRTWTAVAGVHAINDGPPIVHRPGRPEKLTVRADVEVMLPIE
jgi:hypothetical protein